MPNCMPAEIWYCRF